MLINYYGRNIRITKRVENHKIAGYSFEVDKHWFGWAKTKEGALKLAKRNIDKGKYGTW